MKQLSLLLIVIFTWSAYAADITPKALNYAQWKRVQVTDAHNRVVRVANRLTIIRQTTGNFKDINMLETELRGAQKYTEVVQDLTIEDYFNVYLSHFDEKQLVEAAKTMSKEEVAELLKLLLRNKTESAGTPRTSPVIGALINRRTVDRRAL